MKNIYCYISDKDYPGEGFALATVISSSGSTPRKPGASAIFSRKGLEYGTIGGGVLEESVRQIVMNTSGESLSRIYHFDLDHDTSDSENAVCGGRVDVLVDSNIFSDISIPGKIAELTEKRIPLVLVSVIKEEENEKTLINRYIVSKDYKDDIPMQYGHRPVKEALRMLEEGVKGSFESITEATGLTVILESLFPPPRLVIAGAGHVGRAVSHLGKFLGFEVTVIDERAEYANTINLPDADEIIAGRIGETIKKIVKDDRTYIVIVTHGHSKDAEALKACIGSNAVYIGMIGSRAKTAKMRRDFISNGWATEEQWEKIHTPIGLEINSETVEEIAISIAAQLVMVKNREFEKKRR